LRQKDELPFRLARPVCSGSPPIRRIAPGSKPIRRPEKRSNRALITASQLRAARALLGVDQRQLAEMSGVSLPTIQRMEASEGNVRGVVDTLTKVIEALDRAGVELIAENVESRAGGRGVRLKPPRPEPI
jgi:DNA-binding XRE family transcriptional regulator